MLAHEFIENLKMSVNDLRDRSTFNLSMVEQNPIYPGKVDKEKKRMNVLGDCESANLDVLWISSCKKKVEESESEWINYVQMTLNNVCWSSKACIHHHQRCWEWTIWQMQLESNHTAKHIHSVNILKVCSWLGKMPRPFILKIPPRNCTVHEKGLNDRDFEWMFQNMCYLDSGEEATIDRVEVFLTRGTAQLPWVERKIKVIWRRKKQTNWKISA